AADRARVAAAGDVAALGDVDAAVGAEDRAPRRAARIGVRAERAVLPAAQLTGVPVAEDDAPVGHHDRALGEPEIGGEKRCVHGDILSESESGMIAYQARIPGVGMSDRREWGDNVMVVAAAGKRG